MAIVVVGGHSRSVGKTSVVAGLISALSEFHWTALKITQYGHGICSANGKLCDCATNDHSLAVSEERSRANDTDTSRFLVAGAERVFWVRTQQGRLAEAMPRVRAILDGSQNAIIESNSVMKFIRPDLYLVVMDPSREDFKESARTMLDRASAVLIHEAGKVTWHDVSLRPLQGRPTFCISHDRYVTDEISGFVRERLSAVAGLR